MNSLTEEIGKITKDLKVKKAKKKEQKALQDVHDQMKHLEEKLKIHAKIEKKEYIEIEDEAKKKKEPIISEKEMVILRQETLPTLHELLVRVKEGLNDTQINFQPFNKCKSI